MGGVIIRLDEPRTHAALAELAGVSTPELQEMIQQNLPLFHDFERGHISDIDFLKGLRSLIGKDLPDSQLITAWNSMLLSLPIENLNAIEKLKGKYRLFLFSNTNVIHVREVHRRVQAVSQMSDLRPLFEKVYFSQEVGERKPDPASFQLVLDEQGLNPAETLFIDDNPANIDGAATLGIQTWHYPINQPLEETLNGARK